MRINQEAVSVREGRDGVVFETSRWPACLNGGFRHPEKHEIMFLIPLSVTRIYQGQLGREQLVCEPVFCLFACFVAVQLMSGWLSWSNITAGANYIRNHLTIRKLSERECGFINSDSNTSVTPAVSYIRDHQTRKFWAARVMQLRKFKQHKVGRNIVEFG